MPKSPKPPKQPMKNPNIDTTTPDDGGGARPQRRDRGTGEGDRERELEDRVCRRDGEAPEMVPPGTVIEELGDQDTARGEREPEPQDGRTRMARDRGPDHIPGREVRELDDEALVADRANARSSDRRDARDGVDNSDIVAVDPDAAGGKGPRMGG